MVPNRKMEQPSDTLVLPRVLFAVTHSCDALCKHESVGLVFQVSSHDVRSRHHQFPQSPGREAVIVDATMVRMNHDRFRAGLRFLFLRQMPRVVRGVSLQLFLEKG